MKPLIRVDQADIDQIPPYGQVMNYVMDYDWYYNMADIEAFFCTHPVILPIKCASGLYPLSRKRKIQVIGFLNSMEQLNIPIPHPDAQNGYTT